MKLLRITAEGLPLFKEKLDLNFYAQQRVAEEHKNIYDTKDVCTTWLIKGRDISKNNKLIEMLVFAEFDFYSSVQ